MSRIRGKNTKPELRTRWLLRQLGIIGYRIHWGEFKIDIAWPGRKIALFVDSCFWHHCKEHFYMPKTNREFWKRKMQYGLKRERYVRGELKKRGWLVVRLWTHDLDMMDIPRFRKWFLNNIEGWEGAEGLL